MIKSPINMTGRKYKLFDQIKPCIPEHTLLLEPFVGSGDFTVNNGKSAIVNDSCTPLINWLQVLYTEPDGILETLDEYIYAYDLNKENKQGYYFMRDRYNKDKNNPYLFYLLHAHSFSNGIRFNKSGGFNLPFGKRTFNDNMRQNLLDFTGVWQGMDIKFYSTDFRQLDYSGADFVYFDPPYFGTIASYNASWDKDTDNDLLELLDGLDTKWMMSNVFANNGKTSERLIKWSKKYNVIHLDHDYKGSNYHRKNNGDTDEVVIMNY